MGFNTKQIDGGVIEGSRKLTIHVGTSNASTTDQIFFTDNFSFDTGSNWNERTDENNVINGEVGTRSPVSGSATLQLSALDQPIPFVFNLFDEDYYGQQCTFKISDVGRKEVKAGLATVDIKFRIAVTTDIKTLDSDGTTTTASGVLVPS